ncbi:hypothetical protein FS749_016549 [Ceratobasidium sp. UAMH 11750]|nr:hypothetical protein FS749_016549 [Ceratobasidium sp. UAMH 11750]
MPYMLAGFKELYEFSQLPNLQLLTLGLYLKRDNLDNNFFQQPIGSSPLRTLRGSAEMFTNTPPRISARALLHCWPNLEEVVFDMGADDAPLDDDIDNDPTFDIANINQELQNL